MRFRAIAALSSLLLAFTQVNAEGYYCSKYIVIKHGDRCKQITTFNEKKEYYIRNKDLKHINPTLDCNHLSSGNKVCVEAEFDRNLPDIYTIEEGDTCESVAEKLNTTVEILKNVNFNLLICEHIKKQVGLEIDYRKDGDYSPIYTKDSKLVSIDGN